MTTTLRLNSVPNQVSETFRSVLGFPDKTLSALGTWIKANIEAFTSGEFDRLDSKAIESTLQLTESDVLSAASLAMTILHADNKAALIKEMGLSNFEKKIEVLLAPIDIPSRDLEYSRQKGFALRSAIPTLDDVDALCDLRAVFRHLPSGSTSSSHASKVRELIGLEPVAIIGLEFNDSSGNDRPYVFQVSEQGLRNLIKTLEEALAQMEVIRSMKPSTSPSLVGKK